MAKTGKQFVPIKRATIAMKMQEKARQVKQATKGYKNMHASGPVKLVPMKQIYIEE